MFHCFYLGGLKKNKSAIYIDFFFPLPYFISSQPEEAQIRFPPTQNTMQIILVL